MTLDSRAGFDIVPLPGEEPPTLELALRRSAEAGLGKVLGDAEFAEPLITWLHDEIGVRKVWLRIGVRIVSVLVSRGVERAGAGLGTLGGRVLAAAFRRVPGNARLIAFLARLDRTRLATEEFKQVLAGTRAPGDARLTEHLPDDLRIQFVTQAWLHRLDSQTDRQPLLDLSLHADTEVNRFLYSTRRTQLLGRDEELGRLQAFLEASAHLSWWTLSGAGGAGKSRIALELALRNSGTWRIGLLRTFEEFDWTSWRPRGPTALIVDYASERAAAIGAIVHTLQVRAVQGSLPHPVRVLLLVRDAEGSWASDFRGTGTRLASLEACAHGPALVVPALDGRVLGALLGSMVPGGIAESDLAAALEKLSTLDPDGRPLFAMLAGDAIAHGRNLRGWDQAALVRDVLERETAHWRAAGATARDFNLLALCTLTGGLPTAWIGQLDADHFPPADGGDSPESFCPERYEVMSGMDARSVAMPLAPDIVGELFVLEHLRPRFDGDPRPAALREAAWQAGQNGMCAFLTRAAEDFPRHETLRLLDPPPESPYQKVIWCAVAVNLVNSFASAGMAERLFKLLEEVRGLEVYREHLEQLAIFQAIAVTNALFVHAIVNSEPENSRRVYDWLLGVAEAYPQSEEIRNSSVMAASHMAVACAFADRSDAGLRFLDDVRARMGETPTAETAGSFAVAAGNLVICLGRAGRDEEATDLYAQLVRIASEFPDVSKVRHFLARAGAARFHRHFDSEDGEGALAYYEEIRRLAIAHPEDEVVAHAWAECASAQIEHRVSSVERERLMAELDGLTERFPRNTRVRFHRTAGLARLAGFCAHEHPERARSLTEELRGIQALDPDPELANLLIQTLASLGSAAFDREEIDAVLALHCESARLLTGLTHGIPVGAHARLTNVAMVACAVTGRRDEASDHFAELSRTPAEAWSAWASQSDPLRSPAEFRGSVGKNASVLVFQYCEAGERDQALWIYTDLQAFWRAFPEEEELQDAFGQASGYIAASCGLDQSEWVHTVYRHLRSGAAEVGGRLADWSASVARHAVWHRWHAGEDEALATDFAGLRADCIRNLDRPEVREHLARASANLIKLWQEGCKARYFRTQATLYEVPVSELSARVPFVEFQILPDRVRELPEAAGVPPAHLRDALEALRALSAAYPADLLLARLHSCGASDVMVGCCDVLLARVLERFHVLLETMEDPPGVDENQVLHIVHTTLCSITRETFRGDGLGAEILARYQEVTALATAHLDDDDLVERWGRCAAHVLHIAIDASIPETEELWTDLRAIWDRRPESASLRRDTMAARVNRWRWHMRRGETNPAREILAEVVTLADTHPDETVTTAALAALRTFEAQFREGATWL